MINFLEYSSNLFSACMAFGLVLAMDCGAFSKTLTRKDIERYATVIIETEGRCLWYASPDVIGNQEQSNKNYWFLLSLLPDHLRPKIRWIYQVSAPISYLDAGLEQFSLVGIGGLVSLLTHPAGDARLCMLAQRIVQFGPRDVHYFGVAKPATLRKLHMIHGSMPFSTDSSTWLNGAKYDKLIRADGRQIQSSKAGFNFTIAEILSQNIRTMRTWMGSHPNVLYASDVTLQLPLFL